MPQIFVFVASDLQAQHNLTVSIENPIDDEEEKVFGSFPSGQRAELERIREEGGSGFYAWGAVPGDRNIPTWEAMRPGDYVLCVYGKAYHYAARVLAKRDRRPFAEKLWGEKGKGVTWQYMYFLTRPVEVDRSVPEVAEYLHAGYRGFVKISDEKADAILNEFGSVDEFIHHVLHGPEGGTDTTRGFGPVTERDIEELEDGAGLNRAEVEREMAAMRKRLARSPRLKGGAERQKSQTSERPRDAAFELDVKRLYGYRCAICGSALRSPDKKPEVQSAHIYPKREDGWDDARNGVCLCRRHHWAFDVGWISVADDHTVLVRDKVPAHEDYSFICDYEGKKLRPPMLDDATPHEMYLREHRKLWNFE